MVDATTPAVLLALATTFFLTGMTIVTSDIDGEVQEPSSELLTDEGASSNDWGLLGQLSQLMSSPSNTRRILLAGLGDENHISFEVSGRLVVLAMRDLPREVRNQECRVADEADSVVECLGGRKRLVATFVGHNPQTSTKTPLDESIESPSNCTDATRRNVGGSPEYVKEKECDNKGENIPGNIHQASGRRALKAMLGNSSTNVIDAEVRNLELVTIGIDQSAISRFGVDQLVGQFRIDHAA